MPRAFARSHQAASLGDVAGCGTFCLSLLFRHFLAVVLVSHATRPLTAWGLKPLMVIRLQPLVPGYFLNNYLGNKITRIPDLYPSSFLRLLIRCYSVFVV